MFKYTLIKKEDLDDIRFNLGLIDLYCDQLIDHDKREDKETKLISHDHSIIGKIRGRTDDIFEIIKSKIKLED